jgi:hypothetical protein
MKTPASVHHGRIYPLAFLAAGLLAACASTDEVASGNEMSLACPKDLKLHCFKRTARRQDCYCVDPEEMERLLEQIGPKGILERERGGL